MWMAKSTNSAAANMRNLEKLQTSCAGSTACRWWSSPRQRNRHGTPECGKPSTKPVRMPAPQKTSTGRCIDRGTFSAVIHTESTQRSGRGMADEQCGFIGWEKNTILQASMTDCAEITCCMGQGCMNGNTRPGSIRRNGIAPRIAVREKGF